MANIDSLASSSKCPGCGRSGGPACDCTSRNDWYIGCGCDTHGDHGGCTKQCKNYGCVHPIGVTLSGTLVEANLYNGSAPPLYLIERAVEEEKARIQRKLEKKLKKLDKTLERWK